MELNLARQSDIFDATRFNLANKVTVIGAGAIGSHLIYSLAKLGVKDITVYDMDTVEEHNIANQLYHADDIGTPKVQAIYNRLEDILGQAPSLCIKQERYTKEHARNEESNIVFCVVDTMSGRDEISSALFRNGHVDWFIDGRMGGDILRLYCIDLDDFDSIKKYQQSIVSDDRTEVSACGHSISVGATAFMGASMLAWLVIRIQRDNPLAKWRECIVNIETMETYVEY